jgi:preprotein translocase subunit SecY
VLKAKTGRRFFKAGSALLIVVAILVDLIKRIDDQVTMRQY